MHHVLIMFSLLSLIVTSDVHAWTKEVTSHHRCELKSRVPDRHVISTLCVREKAYQVFLDRNSTGITLMAGQHKVILRRIPKGYDPSLVDAEKFIGFLPESLQPYTRKNILVSISAIRTNGGGGGGQCGAGVEVYLVFIDITKPVPKLKSKILIASCAESIELLDQDISSGQLNGISVVDNHLSLHFMNYKNFDGSPTAIVAPDFTRLLF